MLQTELVMNYRGHDEFETLAFVYVEQLYRIAYARVQNKQDAEDIVQDTYLKAFKAFPSFRRGSNVKNWLTQILVNNVRDHFRRAGRTVPTIDIDDDDETASEEFLQIGPEEELCSCEIDPQLVTALSTIPDNMLVPLILREIDDASYDEIATILDIPIGTVMSRLFRARSLLRKKLSYLHTTPNLQTESRGASHEMQ